MSDIIDLHLHTNHSDGVLSPAELLEEVRAHDLAAFAVTDHDTIDGYLEMTTLIEPGDPELVPGLEISAESERGDLHLLAYLFEPAHDELIETLKTFQTERNQRGRRIVDKLNELGVPVEMDRVIAAAAGSAIGRPHIAQALAEQGLVSCFEQAFRKYIGNDGPAYLPKSRLEPGEAIDLIHRAGGVAVMAHPYVNKAYELIDELFELKLDGLEIYHYSHSREKARQLKSLARRHNLVPTGGSDFHGRSEHEGEIGVEPVPLEFLDRLKQRAEDIRGRS